MIHDIIAELIDRKEFELAHLLREASWEPNNLAEALRELQYTGTRDINLIKKQYRKLALKYHPDLCKEPDCQEKIRRLNVAWMVVEKAAAANKLQDDSFSTKRMQQMPPKSDILANAKELFSAISGWRATFRFNIYVNMDKLKDAQSMLESALKNFNTGDDEQQVLDVMKKVLRLVRDAGIIPGHDFGTGIHYNHDGDEKGNYAQQLRTLVLRDPIVIYYAALFLIVVASYAYPVIKRQSTKAWKALKRLMNKLRKKFNWRVGDKLTAAQRVGLKSELEQLSQDEKDELLGVAQYAAKSRS